MFSSYLQNRNGRYYLRLRIPADLSHVFPQTEIVKSLKASNIRAAKEISLPYLQGINQTFHLLRAQYITSEQARKRLNGLIGKKERVKPRRTAEEPVKPKKEPLMLSKVVSTYISDKEFEWTPKTKMESAGVFRLILDLVGNIPVESIDRMDARTLRNKLLKLPANVYKLYPKKSPSEVLQMIEEGQIVTQPMSITSVNKHVTKFSTLLLYCVNEGYRSDNPASGMGIKQKSRPDEERKAYDNQDMKTIAVNLPKDDTKPERFWIPMISMFSGMRLDEVCQLYKEDIILMDGISCFDVNNNKDKKLKSMSSKRIIPLHPQLIEMGLVEYISQCADGARLWKNLTWCKVNGYSNSFGKWYQRYNRRYVTKDPLKCFHSFRHSFADQLKQKEIQENLIAELMGHSNGSITTGRYGKRYQVNVLLETISNLRYDVQK